MKKLIAVALLLVSLKSHTQTLFYYGTDSVSTSEFLSAYQKNNTAPSSESTLRNYLDLYINSRLKIKEARELGYDTIAQLQQDLDNLRQQIIPAYLADKEAKSKLVAEAYERSHSEIHLGHIFISFIQKGKYDTVAARNKLNEALLALKKGDPFDQVARKFSDDPYVNANGGDLGFITAFILPYDLENLAYHTPAGKISEPYVSKSGYHILLNREERKSPGRMKVQQILLAIPPDATEKDKAAIKKRADSLYNLVMKGEDIGKLAAIYSNDIISATAEGQMPDFSAGEYDPVFEQVVMGLQNGMIAKPFLTRHGYHIVKKIGTVPYGDPQKDINSLHDFEQRVEQSDRINSTRAALAEKVLKRTQINTGSLPFEDLWMYSDSVLNYRLPPRKINLTAKGVLFRFPARNIDVSDWISYAQTYRYKTDGSGLKPYPALWDEFIHATALTYYQAHLEDFNDDFKKQINEFREGNLFFEIMQRKIWAPAQADTAALVNYYKSHQDQYIWKQSASAVIFYVNDSVTEKIFKKALQANVHNWHELTGKYSEKVAADSGRFELEQIPNPAKSILKPGIITGTVSNTADHTYSFAYIIKLYPAPQQKNFQEAHGMVLTDYQNEAEKKWLNELRKKYPVRINLQALEAVSRKN